MAVLTATQLARLRDLTGDTFTTLDLSDTEMSEEYTNAESDFDTTIVYVLRRRLGLALKWTDRSTASGDAASSEQRSQRYDHILKLLDYWEGKTGLSGGAIVAGTIDLGLDEDEVTA